MYRKMKASRELHYHLHLRSLSKGKGHVIGQKLAYLRGEKITDLQTGETYNYIRKKEQENVKTILLTPKGASEELQTLEGYTKQLFAKEHAVNAQFIREMEVSLFKELTNEQNEELIVRFGKTLADEGMVVELNLHKGGTDRPHCHIGMNYRSLDKNGNLGNKNRAWNKHNNAQIWRKRWADTANAYFKEQGLNYEISHLSYAARGIDKIAQKKLPMDKKSEAYREAKEYNEIVNKHNARTDYKMEKNEIKQDIISERKNLKKNQYLRGGGVIDMAIEKDETTKVETNKTETKTEQIKKPKVQAEDIEARVKRLIAESNARYEADRPQREAREKAEELARQKEVREMAKLAFGPNGVKNHYEAKAEKNFKKSEEYGKRHKESREVLKEKTQSFSSKQKRYTQITASLKTRNRNLKYQNKQLKTRLKNTSRFSISGFKARKNIKKQMRDNKMYIKLNTLKLKEEKRLIREERIAIVKTQAETFVNKFKKMKEAVKGLYNESKALKAQAAIDVQKKQNDVRRYDNVVNMKDFKAQKEKVELNSEALKLVEVRQTQSQKKEKSQSLAR